ncbi:HK97 gp10 family phage protein [Clostridium sardiniense]|uniref:HK97 gp10 family phage protein n=1 Tax=Clostridium sardiniense TaxID=29369 RepID=A0ABS7KUP6_CLOSR|nr:HK97-gp10 family putative phage morphogenesis protein [Clostridium sardiniense]MBY0754538.1 HK97 gp10 family phage protein [Clostridium sardiniense]MDQ0460866.1 HK97 gp10 family phage protein [Clostridium sardiniense]
MSTIKGLDSLLRKLDKLGGNVEDSVKKSMQKNINLVKDEAKLLCPVATEGGGYLRDRIKKSTVFRKGKVRGIVYTNVEYAAYVEFGTGKRGEASNTNTEVNVSYKSDWEGMQAQPYLYPALKNNKVKILENIKADIKKAIREVARR